MENAYLFGNTEGIHSIDSYIYVKDGNVFSGGEVGISIEGTYPSASGIDIGNAGLGFNSFRGGIEEAIVCQGKDSAVGVNIVNCSFEHVNNIAT